MKPLNSVKRCPKCALDLAVSDADDVWTKATTEWHEFQNWVMGHGPRESLPKCCLCEMQFKEHYDPTGSIMMSTIEEHFKRSCPRCQAWWAEECAS